ncbi:hypothetical protein AB0J72_28395 [Dactylosporangium sp. NPDC049742]|uniref:hypothetical protein n=1 Tax=Dactylosporangium sp. NPDC049742 TaxID=3154737 RepID=UPI00342CD886
MDDSENSSGTNEVILVLPQALARADDVAYVSAPSGWKFDHYGPDGVRFSGA